MHNVHADGPVVFHTRWAMSYLRGPLTRPQVKELMSQRQPDAAPPPVTARTAPPAAAAAAVSAASAPPPAAEPEAPQVIVPEGFSAQPPVLDSKVQQVYLPVSLNEREAVRQLSQDEGAQIEVDRVQLVYEPGLIGSAEVRFVDRKRDINEQKARLLLAQGSFDLKRFDWDQAERLALSVRDLLDYPEQVDEEQGPYFAPAPEDANSSREMTSLKKKLDDWLYYHSAQKITVHPELDVFQHPDETEREFKIRLQQAAREARDEEVDKLEQKYETQMERLEDKLRKEERELAEGEADYNARKQQEWAGIGESVLGFFMGRRSSRAVSSAMSKRRMTTNAWQDIEESKEEIAELQKDIKTLEEELAAESQEITRKWADSLENLSTEEITPRRTDVSVDLVAIAWLPSWLISYHDGRRSRSVAVPAFAVPE
jgi:hypothetical protein